MHDQEWLIGTLTPAELWAYQERLRELQERTIKRHLHLASWLFERQAIAEERRWRREHLQH